MRCALRKRLPVLVMLRRHAGCAHVFDIPPEGRDAIASTCGSLLSLQIETREVPPLPEQSERRFVLALRSCHRRSHEQLPVLSPAALSDGIGYRTLPAYPKECRRDATARGTDAAFAAANDGKVSSTLLPPVPTAVPTPGARRVANRARTNPAVATAGIVAAGWGHRAPGPIRRTATARAKPSSSSMSHTH